jgi:hypothetical protein
MNHIYQVRDEFLLLCIFKKALSSSCCCLIFHHQIWYFHARILSISMKITFTIYGRSIACVIKVIHQQAKNSHRSKGNV